jgi:UMF1 family MFS transporter
VTLSRGAIAWAVFEGGRNPYIVLVIIYIFMPYVASTMVGDPVRGQEMLSGWNQYFGWAVMLTAPLLGASIDKLGPRKGALGLLVALMVPAIASLWWAKPDGSGLSVGQTMFIAMTVLLWFVYTEVLHNSLLVFAAGANLTHKASGLAILLGNFFSVVALAFTAWAFALPTKVDWSWVPASPLFGLDPAQHEPERVVALLSAALLALGAIPLFLFTPDAPRTDILRTQVVKHALRALTAMLRTVRLHKDAVAFLLSRMFYVDGMNAVLIYSGIYAIGVMKWHPLEMLAYAILQSGLGTLGGVVGPRLDAALGSKRALQVEIVIIAVGVLALLGMSQDTICYFWHYDTSVHANAWNGPVFRTLPDWLFIAIGTVNYIFVCANFTSSRTMLTRITPAEQSGAYFGVYALSGVATSWLGPTLVNVGTRLTYSQKGGFATVLLLFAAGFFGLIYVRGDQGNHSEDRQTAD